MAFETETAELKFPPQTIRAGTRCSVPTRVGPLAADLPAVPAREGLANEPSARSVYATGPQPGSVDAPGMQGQIALAATLALRRTTGTLAAGSRTAPRCAARFAFVARLRKSTGLGLRAAGGWLARTTKRGLGLPTSPSSWLAAWACATGSWFAGAGRERSGQALATLRQRWAGAAEAGTGCAGSAGIGSAGTGTTFGGTLILRAFRSGALWTGTVWTGMVRPGSIKLRPVKARTARFGTVEFGTICKRAIWSGACGGPIRLYCVDLKARLLGDNVVGLRWCLASWW